MREMGDDDKLVSEGAKTRQGEGIGREKTQGGRGTGKISYLRSLGIELHGQRPWRRLKLHGA